MSNKEKQRRQVSFNIDDELYSSYKKIMIDKRTTPTVDLTQHIQEVVRKSFVIDEALLEEYSKIINPDKTVSEALSDYIKSQLNDSKNQN